MITAFTTQEEAFESFLKDEVKRGRKEGEKIGEEKGKIDTLIKFFKNGIGLDVISKSLEISIDEVKNILKSENLGRKSKEELKKNTERYFVDFDGDIKDKLSKNMIFEKDVYEFID